MGRRAYIGLLLWAVPLWAAPPVFENRTPVGFAPEDSTVTQDFALGNTVSVRVDLDQAATEEYPVVGHFHAIERSVQVGTTDTDGMQVDIAVAAIAPFGVDADTGATPALHMAWIEQKGLSDGPIYSGGVTPVYQVMYARSTDGGANFSTPVSVSGDLTYHPITADGGGTGFSTLDLEVDSGGRPRVVYAMVPTANRQRQKNVYFSYSQDGGSTWQTPVRVNNLAQAEGFSCAFPEMTLDDRDNVFISYVRGASGGGGADDIMLAKVNRATSPFSMATVGEDGTAGSGGVRLTPDADRHTGPALGLGDNDALHVVYFNDTDDRIEHRRLNTDTTWVDVSASGWNQNADGATVAAFDNEAATNAGIEKDAVFYFPNVAVDRRRLPDRVYALYKFGDNTPAEGLYFNRYDDGGPEGTGASWGTAASVWTAGLFADGAGSYNIELDWRITERVAAAVDQRLDDRGDLHVAFSAGYSGGGEHDIYYARYNGVSWTLPEKVADDDSDAATEDGIAAADVFLLGPSLVQHPNTEHLYLGFAGGAAEGFGVDGVNDANHHAYFKVLGRDISFEDVSVPTGAFQYTLSHAPVNAQTTAAEIVDNPVYVHAADPVNGKGLGARGLATDGFLAGEWETVGTTLADDDKAFEGQVNEDATSTNEWGDDDDKVGLLAKLNVLGSDSATNVQVITSSTASGAGTGLGARTVRVGSDPSNFLAAGAYFLLGADIDIVAANAAPTVALTEPDGSGDTAGTSFDIRYSLSDTDDDLSGSLQAALYVYPSGGLKSVQDIRIFGTLIADQNDVSANNVAGTDDFLEGTNQTYTWDDPPQALQTGALFASILKVQSGDYYVYLVADDGKNAPVFAVSPGALTLRHAPIVQGVGPTAADTVDTGVRTGAKANPYDLDFSVVDYDSPARVQLFYAAVAGLTSVSATGTYPNQKFVLGKSVSGTRGTAITDSTDRTATDKEFIWDVTAPLVPQGDYFLYAVATDSISVSVGHSAASLAVRHSPAFTFYEPPVDTRRQINTAAQPVYTVQWQKGPGDVDLDDDASIALYFTTDDPAVTDHATASGAAPTSLTADADTKLIVSGLSEDSDGPADIYVWDFRNPPNEVPRDGQRVWIYAVISDGGNTAVVRGGALDIEHGPQILLETRLPAVSQGDAVRLEWNDYLVDDGSGTDDAYIRLYAAKTAGYSTLQALENDVASGEVFIVNSSDGTASGTITALRESTHDAFVWDTHSSGFQLPQGSYSIYAGISADATFADNTTDAPSRSSNTLSVAANTGTRPHLSLAPSHVLASVGDTLTFELRVQSGGKTSETVTAVIEVNTSLFDVINPTSPFTDPGVVLPGGTVTEDTLSGTQLRFSKTKVGGQIIGTELDPLVLASFQVGVKSGFSGSRQLAFDDESALSIAGSALPLKKSTGMSLQKARIEALARGRIEAIVLLEGRSPPIGSGDHSTLLDVHLRLPGSTADITDATYISSNDDAGATTDTVEVQTSSGGQLSLVDIPAGRYVLTVKDSSHLSGRTDTLAVRPGEVLTLGSADGFFASDVRGDPSFLLAQNGRLLRGGDATGDNEVDEDDVNAIDAAWGTNTAAANFKQADINNDGRVGIDDLTLTSSNIGNTTGFGAPPVFKAAANAGARARVETPEYTGQWAAGDEVELVLWGEGMGDVAGFEAELSYDTAQMQVLEVAGVGGLFRPNPQGYFKRSAQGRGRVAVAAARSGRAWSAAGAGELLRLRVRLERDGYPGSLKLEAGQLMDSGYGRSDLVWAGADGLLPQAFVLGQNYPNPFNPSTAIPFSVPGHGGALPVVVEIYNAAGQRVETLMRGRMGPGRYEVRWDGRDGLGRGVGSGVYFYRVRVGEEQGVGRMMLLK